MSNTAREYYEKYVLPQRPDRVQRSCSVKLVMDEEQLRMTAARKFFHIFVREFWSEIIPEKLVWNWHMKVLCDELQTMVMRVIGNADITVGQHRKRLPKLHDMLINIPPGTTKSTIASVMLIPWAWTIDSSLKFITGSYSSPLSLEHADLSRDVVKSDKYRRWYPHVKIRTDKDAKGWYGTHNGGSRYSTSVGGTVTGMHGHIIIVDDPLNPKQAASEVELKSAVTWMERTLSTRKIDKDVTPTITIMQRLNEKDPSGVMLTKAKNGKKALRHICLPGEIFDEQTRSLVSPPELADNYVDGMLDPVRLSKQALKELNADLGQYGYAGQIRQSPSPPEGGMFKTARIEVVDYPPPHMIVEQIRYWDKAATDDNPGSAFSAGVKIGRLINGKFIILDVKRGQWSTDDRELNMKQTAQLDGPGVTIWIEQEPGSGGKDSAKATITNLAGYAVHAERPSGDKVVRADPFSVQVNWGNVLMARGPWNEDYLDELKHFPTGRLKDQVDASSGGFNKLAISAKKAGTWGT